MSIIDGLRQTAELGPKYNDCIELKKTLKVRADSFEEGVLALREIEAEINGVKTTEKRQSKYKATKQEKQFLDKDCPVPLSTAFATDVLKGQSQGIGEYTDSLKDPVVLSLDPSSEKALEKLLGEFLVQNRGDFEKKMMKTHTALNSNAGYACKIAAKVPTDFSALDSKVWSVLSNFVSRPPEYFYFWI